ncbi:conjugative transposon protein TraM [Sphingobacterium siyangense]|uniref:Conjugative transposon TraM protein n=1 Tax=Sphingobacterium siyangense TaxID=459529 RepID=A0A562M6Z0_9SPHI|nr:conjugative transposon protein TraM [Sphingobacterium siyangense]TWI15689.1 conjugative transposon TraM protein [Sphingobacterium siyangense]
MKLDLKRPRYIIPLIVLPFILIFFYAYQSAFSKDKVTSDHKVQLQEQISDVSPEVKNKALTDKLNAYRELYRRGDGYTAVNQLQEEKVDGFRFDEIYNDKEKRKLDSIRDKLKQESLNARTGTKSFRVNEDLDSVLSTLVPRSQPVPRKEPVRKEEDPMLLFRRQMEFADSLAKANDPEEKAAREQRERMEKVKKAEADMPLLKVKKADVAESVFNTVKDNQQESFIQAIVDENIIGYVDSRLRIRLMDDLLVGSNLIRKGTYLYAKISGFSGQRVLLSITSIMLGGKILPVKLDLYDNDGLQGLYVPSSAFREFSRELGANSSQGISIQQVENQNQLMMGVIQRMFQSTTTAVSRYIRKNRAKIKYNTLVYLIDPQTLRDNQKQYK